MAKPNIIVIMADDQDAYDTFRFMAKAKLWFGQRGTTFRHSFVDRPLCTPARVSFLTGLASHNHGVLSGNGMKRFIPMEGDSLPVWLTAAGYDTVLIGKYLNGYDASGEDAPPEYVPQGWSQWYGLIKSGFFDFTLCENGTLVDYTGQDNYSTDVLGAKAQAFIRARPKGAKPFFMLLTPNAPHSGSESGCTIPAPRHQGSLAGLKASEEFASFNEADVSDKPGYVQATPLADEALMNQAFQARQEALLALDEMLDGVFAALADMKMKDETVVIYTSDNGFMTGQHRQFGKHVTYEAAARVPLMIYGPGIPAAVKRSGLVSNLDLVATVVALAGAVPGHDLDGVSLLPLIADQDCPWRRVLLLQGQTGNSDETPRTKMWAARAGQDVLIENSSTPYGEEWEYYLLSDDSEQQRNIAGDEESAARVAKLRTDLANLKQCRGAGCWIGAAPAVAGTAPVWQGAVTGRRDPVAEDWQSDPN